MKNFYLVAVFIALFLSNSVLTSQNLEWINPPPTGTGSASIALLAPDAVLLNGEVVSTIGALVGVFYEDDGGNLLCAGYVELDECYVNGGGEDCTSTEGNVNIAPWGTDAGEDNGLADGEIMQFYLYLDGIDYPSDDITFVMGNTEFAANGLYVISNINFAEEQIELDPCSCVDGTIGTIFDPYCILPGGYSYCTDPSADNYCNTEGYAVLGGVEGCIYGEVEGCTCPAADNYDALANTDNGSCYISEGCSDPLANNYSLTGCDGDVSIASENCILLGCTCPEALNYDPTATINDGSCAAVQSLCTDPTAANFNEGCEDTQLFGAVENCEYGGCELENIVWDYEITDANMTIQVGADVVTLNGESPPTGSLLGVFFTNDSGQLNCAGYQEWTGDQLAIAAWGAESGIDNGFQAGEDFTWLLYVGNQTFSANSTTMNGTGPFSQTFVANGFGQLTSVNYDCEVVGVFGCTDSTAYNYNPDATIDDGSCYTLDWDFTVTDCNMTLLINQPEISGLDISLNGEEIPTGAMIGVFYENADGQLVCGGASEWTGTSTSVAAMGSETGNDNGFQPGELLNTWFLLIGDQSIPMDANGATMSNSGIFQDTYLCNAFGNLLSVNFEGEYTISYGCTDETACNYDETAIVDDGSCDYGQTWYQDSDSDGLGNPDVSTVSCNEIFGFVTNDEDPCPDNIDNPNNSLVWYLDEDGDGLGTELYVAYGCNPPGPDFSDILGDPCPYGENTDEDEDGVCDYEDSCVGEYDAFGVCNGDCIADDDADGICDDIDDCVGEYDDCGVCNGPGQIYECGCNDITEGDCDCNGNTLDVLGVCGGGCTADNDADGICDDVDDCVGNYDAVGICNGDCTSDIDGDGVCDTDEIAGCQDEIACNYNPDATDSCGQTIENNFSIEFNVVNDINSVMLDGDLIEEYPITISTDIYINDLVTNNIILSKDNTWCWYLRNDSGNMQLQMYNESEGGYYSNEYIFNENEWYNITITIDANNNIMQYVNGISIPYIYIAPQAGMNPLTFPADKDIRVGEWEQDGESFNGMLDNLHIWNIALSEEDIAQYTTCAPQADQEGLLGFWRFEEGSGNIAFDSSNNSNNGSIYGATYNDVVPYQNCTTSCCTYAPEGETCAGCTDPLACNYNPGSTVDDGSCILPDGCTDETACNYNPDALCDDGSCILPITWYLDDDGDGLGFDSGISGFPFSFDSCDDWSDGYADNADDPNEGDFDNDFVFTVDDCDDTDVEIGAPDYGYDCEGNCINDEDEDGICNEFEILGCTDTIACNYNDTATDEDGTCEYAVEFYNCDFVCLIDTDGDGVCDELEIPGCTDSTACNYDEIATEENNSCLYLDGICETCENGQIIDNDIDDDQVCDDDEIPGCTNPTACNYNEIATDEDDSCLYIDGICETCENGEIIDNDVDNDQVCDDDEIPGCNDSTACNYDEIATDNDGSCLYLDGICETCENGQIIDNDIDDDQVCDDDEIPGCTDPNACNYNEIATDEDSSCLYIDGICETCENGEIIDNDIDNDQVCDDDEIPGCTDPNACNFDPSLGCTDDDGSCFYSEITVDVNIVTSTSCEVECDGEIQLTIANGQPPYIVEYTLVDENGNLTTTTGGDLSNACYGSYAILVTDSYNCESEMLFVYVDSLDPDTDEDGVCDSDEIFGCTEITACNYDPTATEEDYSCITCYDDNCGMYPIEFYDCNGECWNDSDFDGVCDELEVVGCNDVDGCNYSINVSEACEDMNMDGFPDCCTYPDLYYLDCDGNCLNDLDGDGVCDEIEIEGCQDSTACNYNPSATDSGDCMFPEEFYDCEGCINDTDGDTVCDELEIVGCQDGLACNFDPEATDPAECFYLELSTFVDQNIQNVTCPGDADGSFIIYTTGGNAPYTLFIEGFSGTDPLELTSEDGVFTVSGAAGGSYDVIISDVNFCETLETVSIEESNPIDITIDYLDFISCTGGNDGSLTNSIQGGTPPYTFEWLDAGGNVLSTEQDIFNLSAGAYALEVTDDIGCSNQAAFILGEPNVLEIDQLNITDVSCFEGEDGSVEVFIIGGASPFTYTYTDLFGNDVNPNALSEGNYIIIITDDNGCETASDFSIDAPNNELTISIDASEIEICEDEMVEITATNGYDNYIWSEMIDGTIFGNNSNVLEINESGEYMVTAFDENGCEAVSESIEIMVYQNPIFDINGVLEVVTGNTYTYYTDDLNNDYTWSIEPSEMGIIESSENENIVEITWLLEGDAELYLTQIDENECSSTESVTLNITWPIELNEVSQEIDFMVFPNPFDNYTNIAINNPNKVNYSLYLYDIKGTLVKSFINQKTENFRLEKEFSNGVYHLQLISSEGNKRKLIIVE